MSANKKTRVLLIGGEAGAGKSHLARFLARHFGCCTVLDKDPLTWALAEQLLLALGRPRHDRESPTYLKQVRPCEYAALMSALASNIPATDRAIVSAPFLVEFYSPSWLETTQKELAAMGSTLTLAWVLADESLIHQRLVRRAAIRDLGKLGDWAAYRASLPAQPPAVANLHLVHNGPAGPDAADVRSLAAAWLTHGASASTS